ncbi:MAG: gliding motility-associated C-terminal domain-containing protein [Saprospiraceae bacterium]|nr:gliding motility-associated C-terminal domain-containing protein [Saprospiraceae bacterium]MBP8893875.1 gliding motility-associated C-terminal domain-containing protein [Saprospiraceae bacterium]MBP9126426.1 gliding motility-associated C-terminal domain-containing protein [Saprospiraceae bacterium]MBP9846136.1 gliding motility-associated C-terminal domain-containing protein [Saprospiraceae bacterium]
MKSNRLHTFIINKFRNYNWKYLLVSLILCSSSFVYGQSKLILTTGVDKGWTITKKNQPYPTNPLPPNTDWLINKTPDVLNDQWTDKVVLANITLDQIIPVQNVGNKAKPIWIAENLCNYLYDAPSKASTYNFRKTFYLSDCIDIKSAILLFTTDNICRFYINGKQIERSGGLIDFPGSISQCQQICGVYSSVYVENPPAFMFNSQGVNILEIADVKDYLQTGMNVIAIENLNTGGCETNYAWVCANMEIQYTGSLITTQIDNLVHQDCSHDGSFEVVPTGGIGPYIFRLGSISQNNGKYKDLSAGDYYVVVEDATGCEEKVAVTVQNWKVLPELVVEDIDISTDCFDTTASITLNPKDKGYDIQYSIDDGPYLDQSLFTDLLPGVHKVIGINEFGCNTKPYEFEIFFDEGKIVKNEVINLCHGEQILLFGKLYDRSQIISDTTEMAGSRCDTIHRIDLRIAELKEKELSYEICPGDTIDLNGTIYAESGNYSQHIIDKFGCDSTIYIRIDEKDEKLCAASGCDFFIPNVFSPNDDGINDVFKADAYYIKVGQLSIFNRWGAMIFDSNGPEFSWDGSVNGQVVMPGAYVYILKGVCVNGIPFLKSGSVTVMR